MAEFIIRLDDACEKMDVSKWDRMEYVLDKYGIRPLVGVIPHCEDKELDIYDFNPDFWDQTVNRWIKKGWEIALHGYNHVYATECGGINPVNKRSEFAGEPIEIQREKIKAGMKIFASHSVKPNVFFAPAHTFDNNTLKALYEETDIRIISDTVANAPYFANGFTFVPQQSGRVRKLPFKTVTFCYHPNIMEASDFVCLDNFLAENKKKFVAFPLSSTTRKKGLLDKILEKIYFMRR